MKIPLALVASLLLVVSTGCGGNGDTELLPPTAPTTSGETEPTSEIPEDWTVCANQIEGFEIAYPVGWHTDELTPDQRCSFFDPEPFEIVEGSEFPLTAIEAHPLGAEGRSFDQIVKDMTNPMFEEMVSREDLTVQGFPAVRIETAATGEGLLDKGTRTYAYLIDRDGEPFLVQTHTHLADGGYGRVTAILDKALASLRFFTPTELPAQDLPEAVAAKREAIADAARAGDTERLLELMAPNFTYSFGLPLEGGPVEFWQLEKENLGVWPPDLLPDLLAEPYAMESEDVFVWPAGYESTLGWRAGIRRNGDWIFFVAGD